MTFNLKDSTEIRRNQSTEQSSRTNESRKPSEQKVESVIDQIKESVSLNTEIMNFTKEGVTKGWIDSRYTRLYKKTCGPMQVAVAKAVYEKFFQSLPKDFHKATVADFGCGTGQITEQILAKTFEQVDGYDISKEMIKEAVESQIASNLSYTTLLNPEGVLPEGKKYRYIFSSCVFHMVPKPLETLLNLKKSLENEGKICFAYTARGNIEFFNAGREAVMTWNQSHSEKIQPTPPVETMLSEEGAKSVLEEAGYQVEICKLFEKEIILESKEYLVEWLQGTMGSNWSIPFEKSEDFFMSMANKYIELNPTLMDEKGQIHLFPVSMEIVANVGKV